MQFFEKGCNCNFPEFLCSITLVLPISSNFLDYRKMHCFITNYTGCSNGKLSKVNACTTGRKFYDFAITQILHEINFVDSRSAKSAIFTHLEALNLDFYEFLNFLKAEIFQISKIQRPWNVKNCSFCTSRIHKIDFT